MTFNIVPDNSLLRSTFKIITPSDVGTCFQYMYKIPVEGTNQTIGNSFVVTASHLFPGAPNEAKVKFEIERLNDRKAMEGTLYRPEEDGIDMAVIHTFENLTDGLYYDLKHGGEYSIGQDVYFCGFPLELSMKLPGFNNDYPLPITKKACISAFVEDTNLFLFDGHNNKGFSGAPIGYHDLNKKETHIIGVVCAYYPQIGLVKIEDKAYEYAENSGIFMAFSFQHAVDIFDELKEKGVFKMP